MAEVILQFTNLVKDGQERRYMAQVCGRRTDDDHWEGWIEFLPVNADPPQRTPRETKQPDRDDLEYWATGLTHAYLEGALARALRPPPTARPARVEARPAFEGPAPGPGAYGGARARGPDEAAPPDAILDPYQVYQQGEEVLRNELSALGAVHLRNIIEHYGMGEVGSESSSADRVGMIATILAAVRERGRGA